MYGCSDAVLVYGFNMGDRESIIDHDYLNEVFPDINLYASDVVRNYLGESIYGIQCAFDPELGQAMISPLEAAEVQKLYDKYMEYLQKKLSKKQFNNKKKSIKMCFHLAIIGDYEIGYKESIILDENWMKKNEEDEEDEKYEEDEEDENCDDVEGHEHSGYPGYIY